MVFHYDGATMLLWHYDGTRRVLVILDYNNNEFTINLRTGSSSVRITKIRKSAYICQFSEKKKFKKIKPLIYRL